jgi:Zn-dependent protease
MGKVFTVGRIYGIPIRVDLGWLCVAGLLTWSLGAGYFPKEYPDWTQMVCWVVGAGTSFLFFVSILLHELAHSIVASREGIVVQNITLFFFGGYTEIEGEPGTPTSELRIAAAGPLASLAISGLFFLASWVGRSSVPISAAALYLFYINIILVVFNLIPGFPLDGGRIIRAIIWSKGGDYWEATGKVSLTGQGISYLIICAAAVFTLMGNPIPGLGMAVTGWFLHSSAVGQHPQEFVLNEIEMNSQRKKN